MSRYDFMLVGVGGQGTLLASDVLAATGVRAGLDVKKSEVHGMAQRGGSVTSHVRWAHQVFSPLIGRGEAGYMVAFEKLEAVRFAGYLQPGAVIVVNDHAIPPISVSAGGDRYPSDAEVRRALAAVSANVHFVNALSIAESLGEVRANNMVLLGALSRFVDVDLDCWLAAIAGRVSARTLDINRAAFLAGRQALSDAEHADRSPHCVGRTSDRTPR